MRGRRNLLKGRGNLGRVSPSARRVTRTISKTDTARLFQPTPSARRVTNKQVTLFDTANISTHTLRKEGDPTSTRAGRWRLSFQPTPSARRVTSRSFVPSSAQTFQPTPSARRVTKSAKTTDLPQTNFNPHPPQGG